MSAQQAEAKPNRGVLPRLDGLETLFDVSGIDFSACVADRAQIAKWNPHRGMMALLDGVVWHNDDYRNGIGRVSVREDAFWVEGHFPGNPMLPGVLMVESAAQLCCYLFLVARNAPGVVAFTRLTDTTFRSAVLPGDDLYILSMGTKKRSRRRFECKCQGFVEDRLCFTTTVTGILIDG